MDPMMMASLASMLGGAAQSGDFSQFGLVGGLASRPDPDDTYRLTRGRLRKSIKGEESRREPLYAAELANLMKMMEQQDKARSEVGRAESAQRRSILDRERSAMGGLSSSLASRGLTNTTFADTARRGLAGQTNAELGDLSGNFAGLYSNLALQKGGAFSNLADFYNRRNVGDRDLFQKKFGVWEQYG